MKILVVLSRVPWPLDKGDKLRAYYQLRELAKNHSIHLVALNDKPLHPDAKKELEKYCDSLHIYNLNKIGMLWNILAAFFKGKPLQVGYFYNRAIHLKMKMLIRKLAPDHIYAQLVRTADYVSGEQISKTLDYQDALSAGLKRRFEKEKGLKQFLLKFEYRRMKTYERKVFDEFDIKTIITAEDRELIPHPQKEQILIVPNGVDMDFFHPLEAEKIYDIVFTGNMNYPPNILAARFLVNEILPFVRKEMPEVKVLIAGADPHASVKELASGQVTVSGWMEDIRTAYASSKVFVAPMQIGTGLQNKLLEAMAMKIPAVSSKLANKALKARPGEQIRVAWESKPKQFAGQIVDLLSKPERARTQAEEAFKFVQQKYSWPASVQLLEQRWKDLENN